MTEAHKINFYPKPVPHFFLKSQNEKSERGDEKPTSTPRIQEDSTK